MINALTKKLIQFCGEGGLLIIKTDDGHFVIRGLSNKDLLSSLDWVEVAREEAILFIENLSPDPLPSDILAKINLGIASEEEKQIAIEHFEKKKRLEELKREKKQLLLRARTVEEVNAIMDFPNWTPLPTTPKLIAE